MPIFFSKKNGDRSVNFAVIDGLPGYQQNDAINATIEKATQSLVIRARVFQRPEIHLPLDRITYAESKTETEVQEYDKSVIGRAAIGTLLAGPFGALIGGMSGIGSKKKKTLRQFLILSYTGTDNEEKAIALEIVGASIGWREFLTEIRPSSQKDIPATINL